MIGSDIKEAVQRLFSRARLQGTEKMRISKHLGSQSHKDKKKRRAKQKRARASRKRNR